MRSVNKVVLAGDFPRDERRGSARVPLRTAAELERLGIAVTCVFSEELWRTGRGRADELTGPARMAARLAAVAADADVVDIAGFDGWLYARAAHWLRPRQAVIARSNGLWMHGMDRPAGRGAARELASDLYQRLFLLRWERASIAAADAALFMCSGDADEVVRMGWQTADRVGVANPAVDDFFASPVPLDSRRDVAFVGTFFERKGSEVAAAAMAAVLRDHPKVGFTLLGPGIPEADVRARFDASVQARITVVDVVPASELARRLGEFAVLVFPTRYEGFGLVVLEAMRAGLAVVTTPTGAGVDVVRDGENGLIVPFGDAGATARAVGRVLVDSNLRMKLARAAVEEARARTWARTAAEVLAVYERARARALRRPGH